MPKNIATWTLLGLFAGTIFGLILNFVGVEGFVQDYIVNGVLNVPGQIFFNLLKFLVVPVVFISIVCGTAQLDDIKRMGRVGGKTMFLYMITTMIAICLALILAIIVGPGRGFNLVTDSKFQGKESPPLGDVIIALFPSNIFEAFSSANMLQIIVAAGLFGMAMTMAGDSGKKISKFFGDLNEVIMGLVTIVMWFAPIGVFFLIAKVFATQGFQAFVPLASYFVVVLAGLVLHAIVTYGSILKFMAKLSFRHFIYKFREVIYFAFSTSSSNATLPITLRVAETKLGIHNEIAAFTLPLGATVNMDGTAIMQGVATIFIAQAYGIDLTLSDCGMVVIMATLASIGTAGVPSVGLVMLTMVLKQVNLPVEGIGMILAVDRLLDMSRTVINVMGDAVVSVVVAKSEKLLDLSVFNSKD